MTAITTAIVGAAGGVGATRTALELGAVVARDGRSVAVVDAAYATQGLAAHCSGRLDPDVTSLVTDATDEPLSAALVDLADDAPGRLAVAPARAPFERVARAKAPEAARALTDRVADAAAEFDVVLVDAGHAAANQSVAVATAADRVVAAGRNTPRGADAIGRLVDRLRDVGSGRDETLLVDWPSDDDAPVEAAGPIPWVPAEPTAVPLARSDDEFAAAVAATATEIGVAVDREFESESLLAEMLPGTESADGGPTEEGSRETDDAFEPN